MSLIHASPIEPLEPRTLLSTSTINAASIVRTIAPNLLGINVATWDPDLNTATTLQLSQAAGLQAVRMPGGSTTDVWHFNTTLGTWAMSIGQMAEYATQLNATAIVTVNYGTGSPQEAVAEWAYLCGSTTDTTAIGTGSEFNTSTNTWQSVNWQTVGYWASLRAASPLKTDDGLNFLRIDHPTPFVIPDWEMGNEIYGTWETDEHNIAGDGLTLPNGKASAAHDPTTYVAFIKAFATEVRPIITAENAPTISIGVVSGATDSSYGNWITNVLKQCKSQDIIPDFISDHLYDENPGGENDATLLADPHTIVTPTPASPMDWSQRATAYQNIINSTLGSSGFAIQLLATEINSVSSEPGKQSVSLVNGLFMADSLGSIMDTAYNGAWDWDLYNGGSTSYNNSSTLYGWRDYGDYGILGNGSVTGDNLYMPEPDYFAEQLFSKIDQTGATVVTATSDSTLLDTFAVLEPDGHLDLLVINKNPAPAGPPNNLPDTSITEQFNLQNFKASGAATIWQYGVAQDDAQATTGSSALAQQSLTFAISGGTFSYTIPSYSMSVIDLAPALSLTAPAMYLKLDADGQHVDVWNNATNTGNYSVQYPQNQLGFATLSATAASTGSFTFDLSAGNFLPAAGITFDGDGIDSLVVIGTTGNDTVAATTSAVTISGDAINYTNVSRPTFNPGSGTDALALATNTNLSLAAPPAGGGILTRQFSSLTLAAGAELDVTTPASESDRALLVIANLSISSANNAPNARLDLGGNDPDVQNISLATITPDIVAGSNFAAAAAGTGQLWTGEGITSSAAAHGPMALALIENTYNGQPLYGAAGPMGPFDGFNPGATDILIKYTLLGDANLDGKVDGTDYLLIDNGFAQKLTGWLNGDFNYDGQINGDDYSLMDNAFNSQTSLVTTSVANTVAPAPLADAAVAARQREIPSVPPKPASTNVEISTVSFADASDSDSQTTGIASWIDQLF